MLSRVPNAFKNGVLSSVSASEIEGLAQGSAPGLKVLFLTAYAEGAAVTNGSG